MEYKDDKGRITPGFPASELTRNTFWIKMLALAIYTGIVFAFLLILYIARMNILTNVVRACG